MAQVRGKVAVATYSAVLRASAEDVGMYDTDGQLLTVAGTLISDNTPDARESARQMAPLLRAGFETTSHADAMQTDKENAGADNGVAAAGEEAVQSPWESFCLQHLNSCAAAAVLKATSAAA